MNKFTASVHTIQSLQNLHIVSFTCNGTMLAMMSLDLDKNIQTGTKVLLTCKPTAIAIAKNLQGELSHANQLHVKVLSIQAGQLLSAVQLQFHELVLESVITTDSLERMRLKTDEEVIALVKSSDLSIKEVLL